MFPFWGPVIAPVLEAAQVRSVVEVGALRGDTTRQVIERLGPDAVLHVIDPVPGFDPSTHEREFPGRYVFHQALSLDVLGDLGPMDAALIDGDHNWYTVYNELRLLREVARTNGAALPVLVLHDVGWPYGRRDLYYAPGTIPAEFRRPHRRAGMRPGHRELLPDGQGMSQGLWNAEEEGGPRNGVRTALNDFVAEHDRPLRQVVLPLYFGLAIVVEEERLERQPALRAELDRIEGASGKQALIEMGERIRLRGVANHHTVVRRQQDRLDDLARRHVEGVGRELVALGLPGAEGLEPFRRALAELDPTVPGDVVVSGRARTAAALLARVHLDAHDLDGLVLVVGEPGEGRSDPPLAELAARFGLDPAGIRSVEADGPPDPVGGAVLAGADAGAGPALFEHLGSAAVLVELTPG